MPSPLSYAQTLFVQGTSGPNIQNTAAIQSLLGSAPGIGSPINKELFNDTKMTLGKMQIPGPFLAVGRLLRFIAVGKVSCINPTPGTLAFVISDPVSAQFLAVWGPFNLNTTAAKTNVTWMIEAYLSVRTPFGDVVNGVTFMHAARFMSEVVIGSPAPAAGGSGMLLLPPSNMAPGGFADPTTDPVTFEFSTQFSVANAGNNIQAHFVNLEAMN